MKANSMRNRLVTHRIAGDLCRTVRTGVCAIVLTVGALGLATPAGSVEATNLRISQAAIGSTQHVQVGQNKSVIVDLPVDAGEVIISQPGVATAIMRTKRRAIIQGINDGETNIFFLDPNGNTITVLELAVKSPPSRIGVALQDALNRILPMSSIQVESVNLESANNEVYRVVLAGTAQSNDDINKAIEIAAQFAGGPDNVASVVTVSGSQQVMLKVTVAEVTREVIHQLGLNLNASVTAGGLTTGLINSPPIGGASGVVTGNSLTAGLSVGNVSIEATLRALERRGAVKLLAEPTLTAISGQEAEFLAGGEYPVPISVDEDCNVGFEFKEFGANLVFTPVVQNGGNIGLTIETSVSEITTEGGFSACGITIPATTERRARTSVELPSGSTLAIAGLLQDKVRQQINQLPGLGSVPILGALFRSRDYVRSQTELLILVTPYLASAGPAPRLPTDDFHPASTAEGIFLGRMEQMYGVGGNGSGNNMFSGSVGFVLD
jgi:pilus assembly protein CpaC